jgi:predicted transcriptional regulator YdeE
MEETKIETFQIIGIAVRTTNENQQAAKDIGDLWNRFITKEILQKTPNKVDNTIYSVYTDYESDYTKPYTTILGCKVTNTNNVPKGMISKTITGGKYIKFVAKGNLTEGAVFKTWTKIWETDLQRKYTTDFEVYGEKAQNPLKAEVPIFIATK